MKIRKFLKFSKIEILGISISPCLERLWTSQIRFLKFSQNEKVTAHVTILLKKSLFFHVFSCQNFQNQSKQIVSYDRSQRSLDNEASFWCSHYVQKSSSERTRDLPDRSENFNLGSSYSGSWRSETNFSNSEPISPEQVSKLGVRA